MDKKALVGIVVGSMILNAGVSWLLMQWREPVTVSFDMAGTVNSFMHQAAEKSLDEGQIKALTAKFNRSLNDSLNAYQRQHHAVVLVAPAVVGGAADITEEIQNDIARRMRD